jgi:hypothetical protein
LRRSGAGRGEREGEDGEGRAAHCCFSFLSTIVIAKSEATKQSIFPQLAKWIACAPGKLAWSCR